MTNNDKYINEIVKNLTRFQNLSEDERDLVLSRLKQLSDEDSKTEDIDEKKKQINNVAKYLGGD